jgi:SHS2 domain-containing protein
MKPFEYFDHTADTMFRAYGKNFDEALKHAILAVYNVIVETKNIAPVVERSFEIRAQKKETLVYEVFEELLFLLDTESFLCHEVKVCQVKIDHHTFLARIVLLGDTNATLYDVFGQIKAPTYSDMMIGDMDGKVFIQAVLDL